MKKNLILRMIFILYSVLLFSCKENIVEKTKNEVIIREKSEQLVSANFDYLPKPNTNQIVVHQNYTLSYNEEYEQAEWVAYTLKKENLKGNNFDRPFFIQDKKVKTGSSDWRNYKNSGYDKGHLCPAGDMKFSKN